MKGGLDMDSACCSKGFDKGLSDGADVQCRQYLRGREGVKLPQRQGGE